MKDVTHIPNEIQMLQSKLVTLTTLIHQPFDSQVSKYQEESTQREMLHWLGNYLFEKNIISFETVYRKDNTYFGPTEIAPDWDLYPKLLMLRCIILNLNDVIQLWNLIDKCTDVEDVKKILWTWIPRMRAFNKQPKRG